DSKLDFDMPSEALAQVMSLECRGEKQVDYQRYAELARDPSWRMFLRANLKRQRNDRAAAAEIFAKVIGEESTADILRIEAARRWLQFANQAHLNRLVLLWSDLKSREAWVKTGNILFTRLVEQNHGELA